MSSFILRDEDLLINPILAFNLFLILSLFSKARLISDSNLAKNSSAIVFNKGPENLSYFFKQRRRIFNGHLHVRKKYGYKVSTMSVKRILKALLEYFKIKSIKNLKEILWLFFAMFFEGLARFLAVIDFYFFKKIPYKWEMVK